MVSHTEVILGAWQHLDHLLSTGSTAPIVLTGHDLSIADIVLIASASAVEALEVSLSALESGFRDGHIIYGVNTGFGGSADIRTREVAEIQKALIRELHYGILPPAPRDHQGASTEESPWSNHRYDLLLEGPSDVDFLPWSCARATIAIRINSLMSGFSAVRPTVVERMRDLLKYNIIPMIPVRGSISASGDLSPMSYVCGAILGKPTIRILSEDSEAVYADVALANAGIEPVKLQMKEGLAMTNGTALSSAVAALSLHDTHTLALFGQIMTAMTVEALIGTKESFYNFFSQTRPHPGQTECAPNNGTGSILRQDRYSIRTAPQWLGLILEDLILAHQQVLIECNSATDKSTCNFQAKSITSAMEKTRQGIQGIGRMLFAQCTELMNPATNRGLPPNLVAEDPSISLIFGGTDLNIASLAAELGFLANPVNHVQTAEIGNHSLNSLALISARYTHTANNVLSQMVAAHMITFLEFYQAQFKQLVEEHYYVIEQRSTVSPSSLWNQLLVSLDATASMDASERFIAIAKSLRSVVLDNTSSRAWCVNRDAYLVHGNAAPLLGKASKAIYTFMRQELKVPLLSTRHLLTPSEQDLKERVGGGTQAPTVGSYTGAVYRALRDGSLMKVAINVLQTCG
ncbi:phenylalanine and histidine ammonia-lyase [Xylaria scruposa]|nr:phenylalanine and histidine ammonia-lyase [Xylaria scruposa]